MTWKERVWNMFMAKPCPESWRKPGFLALFMQEFRDVFSPAPRPVPELRPAVLYTALRMPAAKRGVRFKWVEAEIDEAYPLSAADLAKELLARYKCYVVVRKVDDAGHMTDIAEARPK